MPSMIDEEAAQTAAAAPVQEPKGPRRVPVRHVARPARPPRASRGKKGKAAKKASKGAKRATSRDGSKAASILDLLKRKDGATLADLMKATGW